MKTTNGLSISPDAVTVTATVALIVCEVDVRPLTVLDPAEDYKDNGQ